MPDEYNAERWQMDREVLTDSKKCKCVSEAAAEFGIRATRRTMMRRVGTLGNTRRRAVIASEAPPP